MLYLIGQGNDVHELVEMKDGQVMLGGYPIKTDYRVMAHSDGDVILHSVANAILGALQMGDIGEYFSDTDPKTKGLDSKKIIAFAIEKMKKRHYHIVNLDLTVTCENIILGSNKQLIKNSLCKVLDTGQVNVKATRFEHPCSLIKCDAVILLTKFITLKK